MHFVRNMGDANTNAPTIVSLRGAQRRSNLVFYGEIAAPPSVARNDRVAALFAFVLGRTLGEDRRMLRHARLDVPGTHTPLLCGG